MTQRRVDAQKELELELGRWKKKAADQQKEIAQLKGELEEYELGRAQLSRAVDGVLAETAKKFGEKRAEGGWQMCIPAPKVTRDARDYDVLAQRDAGDYVVTVRPKKAGAR